jgi:hypothetical protein
MTPGSESGFGFAFGVGYDLNISNFSFTVNWMGF